MGERSFLSIENVTKYYPGVVALNNVSLVLRYGEIHALIGENGAGKSTLVKVLSGAEKLNSGSFSIEGRTFHEITPKVSREIGIEVIYQEFNLIPSLSVSENLFMGDFEGNGIFVDFKSMNMRAEKLFSEMGVQINPRAIVSSLSMAEMQIVEIAKALIRDAKLLIMDEPTAPLTINETEVLFSIVRKLRERGVTIIYISHRLSEVFELSDRVTVMRDGEVVITKDTVSISRAELIKHMVGRELSETYPHLETKRGDMIMSVSNYSSTKVRDFSFDLYRGEILGFAGLVGAGRTELMRLIFGADRKISGQLSFMGKDVIVNSPRDAVELGIAYIPEDRKLHGVFLGLPILMNITLSILKDISKLLFVKRQSEHQIVAKYIDDLKIKTPSIFQLVKNLSGGNQQKVALSKWLASDAEVIIFDEPTRGIDVGAKQEIYTLMKELANTGKGIIMVTSEMEELLGMSDRIIVLHEGSKVGVVDDKALFEQEIIMEMASGGHNTKKEVQCA
jgi:ribose transport system ATP-binding protein